MKNATLLIVGILAVQLLPVVQVEATSPVVVDVVGTIAASDGSLAITFGSGWTKDVKYICNKTATILKGEWTLGESRSFAPFQTRKVEYGLTITPVRTNVPATTSQTLSFSSTTSASSGQADQPQLALPVGLPGDVYQVQLYGKFWEQAMAPPSTTLLSPIKLAVYLDCSGITCLPPYEDEGGEGLPAEFLECQLGPILTPAVGLSVDIAASVPAEPYVCTGTHHPAVTGMVEVETEVGAVVASAKVKAGLSFTVLEQYDFACDFALWAHAGGGNGYLRKVVLRHNIQPATDATCEYTGIPGDSTCHFDYPVLADAFGGAGVAGPGGILLPTTVEVCPPEGWGAEAQNQAYQDLPALWYAGTSAVRTCTTFGIHY